jgi:hypothetical protein
VSDARLDALIATRDHPSIPRHAMCDIIVCSAFVWRRARLGCNACGGVLTIQSRGRLFSVDVTKSAMER